MSSSSPRPESASSDGYSSGSEAESDRELQIALKAGLLQKSGLNVITEKKRPFIYKTDEIEQKLFQLKKKRDWLDTLDVKFSPELSYDASIDDDFAREAAFLKQAQSAASIALPRLHSMKVSIFRPADYFAEMAKSDDHMQKVRSRLVDIQKTKDQRDKAVRIREEKKFAVKVQRTQEERKRTEKRQLMEAVKQHRKGKMKGQLDAILNNASNYDVDVEDNEMGPPNRGGRGRGGGRGGQFSMSRKTRDTKYGFGGQKKRSKKNDKESFESPFGQSHRGGRKGGVKRGGISKRQSQKGGGGGRGRKGR